jgi:ATP-dependent 26S proteasome regulatory subunit
VKVIVLPISLAKGFKNLGIKSPKEVLIYGSPGTGKLLLAKACAAQTKFTYLKLAGLQLVQFALVLHKMYICEENILPAKYDSCVKAMKVDKKPTKDYNVIGGLDIQIEELVEAIVLPMSYAKRFKNLGINC